MYWSGTVRGDEIEGSIIRPSTEPLLHQIIMTSMAAYIVLMAIPFVPGVEIGLALMMIFGPKIVPLVYGFTLISLCLAFLAGRLLPETSITRFLREVRLVRAASFLENFHGLDAGQRLDRLTGKSPRRWMPWLLKHRYLALMLAINLPGNMILGGADSWHEQAVLHSPIRACGGGCHFTHSHRSDGVRRQGGQLAYLNQENRDRYIF